ncbi:MAG: RraA family protein [Candidatus Thermoplasmatota archaeon]|nr:RraA family protein [Candidatus Thermoplasmatota archaeon]MCL5680519.1 RraA family protein [Candidatus Thermoplasmatota archaeon]
MNNDEVNSIFSTISTPNIADSCVRLKIPIKVAPPGIKPLIPGMKLAGKVLPVHHRGSVDIFIEKISDASQGDILVIDNGGRNDEGCIGDLTVYEAKVCGVGGIIVWGRHRDTGEIIKTGVPVFSYGAHPVGPVRTDERESLDTFVATFGHFSVTASDVAFADDDGVIFVPQIKVKEVLNTASTINSIETKEAEEIQKGNRLFYQLDFQHYLEQRSADPSYTLRKHLKKRGGAIEE